LKPLDAFYNAPGTRDGRRNDCKPCNLAEKARQRQLNPEANRVRAAQWRRDNPDRARTRAKAYGASGRKKVSDRKSYLKRKYGITIEEYDTMLAAQHGGCAICGRPPRSDISLHVDHDHETGRIRGILCFSHNNALADFGDDPALLAKAIAYLDPPERNAAIERRLAELRDRRPAWTAA
jgi:hypothetical protein